MRQWTYLEMKTKVEKDLDLEDETFIQPDEMLGYFNEAIDNVEADVHTIYEDYFLTTTTLSLVTGTQDYSFPSDIYANKIRDIYYTNGQIKYQVRKWSQPLHMIALLDNTDDYRYIPINTSANGYQLRILPPSQETSTNMTIWYLRNAKRMVNDSDVCDIPEFINYVIQFVKQRCYEKEGHVNTLKAIQDTEMQKKLMVETLSSMVDDEDNEIRKDFSFYEDFDSNYNV